MNKTVKLWWIASGLMVLCFGFTCLMDFVNQGAKNSAPYWAYVAVRALEFLLPAALFACFALFIGLRHKKKA